jgi:signal transduction histidine kinase
MQDVSLEKEYEQKLATAIIETQEKERKEISMEMHDNVNQLLSATLLYLGLAAKSIPHEKEVVDLLGNCNNYVNDAIKDIRKLSHRLTPHAMEDVSMREIFEWLLEPMNETNQFAVNLYMNEYDNNLISNTIQTHLYRILQEQLTNIVKYARASQVDVRISVKSCSVEIRIKDDGIGFDSHAPRKGIGLKNINSRAQLLSGTMAINTAPGEGCELLIKIPLSSSLSATG